MIDKKDWHICKVCGYNIAQNKLRGYKYNTDKFRQHLIIHNISLEEYFVKHCGHIRPECQCNYCNKMVNIMSKGGDFRWSKSLSGHHNNHKGVSGENHHSFGKSPPNKGLTKDNCEYLKRVSEYMKNRIVTDECRKKMSESAKKRKIHGHTGIKHSEESKNKMRLATIKQFENKRFKQTKTKPALEFAKLLDKYDIQYKEEFRHGYFCFDFYLIDNNLYIEVDGDYWHSNPKKYVNGPVSKTQKINYARDISKNNYCKKNKLTLLRFWECDIINNLDVIEEIICRLKK